MAQAKPIIFIHGLFQGPFRPGVAEFLSPNPVSIPDLPGYGTHRHIPPEAITVDAAADFICGHIHELGYDQAQLGWRSSRCRCREPLSRGCRLHCERRGKLHPE